MSTPYQRLYTSVLKCFRPESAISVTTLAFGPSRSATRIAATTFAPRCPREEGVSLVASQIADERLGQERCQTARSA
jgi:hypothetical protein